MKSKVIISAVVFILALFFSNVLAGVPKMINYQGKITKPSGALIDTTVSMTFIIYADPLGMPPSLWSETQDSVRVESGVFSVLLGSVNPIPDSVFDGNVKYLALKVGSDAVMMPLRPIVSVAYAYVAGKGYFDDGIKTGDTAYGDGIRFGKRYSYEADINPIVTCYSGYVWWDYNDKQLKFTETNGYNNCAEVAGYREETGASGTAFAHSWVCNEGTWGMATLTHNGDHATFDITSEGPDAGYIHIHCMYSNHKLVCYYWYRYQ
jgi:hypothetical protein